MNVHKNARLTPLGRERIVRQVASGGGRATPRRPPADGSQVGRSLWVRRIGGIAGSLIPAAPAASANSSGGCRPDRKASEESLFCATHTGATAGSCKRYGGLESEYLATSSEISASRPIAPGRSAGSKGNQTVVNILAFLRDRCVAIIGRLDEPNRAALVRMSDALLHRGPDASGMWVSAPDARGWGALLAHRRLSKLTGLAASFHWESGPLAKLGDRFARCPGRGGSRRSALWRHGGRCRGRHRERPHCRTLDQLCGPPDRRGRRTRDPSRRSTADRRNQHGGWRLVSANDRSHQLFEPRTYLFVDRLLYFHLPYYSCGHLSAYRAD